MAVMLVKFVPVGTVEAGELFKPHAITVLLVVKASACPRPAATATTPLVGGCVARVVLVTE
jgi:hypothetical protein